ncbi:MAG: adenylyl-sulfate kinase [Ginsengibacter sp.]
MLPWISKEDRNNNVRRLAFITDRFYRHNIISIICAINPYEEIRKEIEGRYGDVKTIYIKCPLGELTKRDTKGLYAKALLPEGNINKITNLSGVNDHFESPERPDLIIETDKETIPESSTKLTTFIESNI